VTTLFLHGAVIHTNHRELTQPPVHGVSSRPFQIAALGTNPES